MAASEAQKKATKQYLEKNGLVEIRFRVKASQKAEIQENIKKLGYTSINQFATQAMYEKIERENQIKLNNH